MRPSRWLHIILPLLPLASTAQSFEPTQFQLDSLRRVREERLLDDDWIFVGSHENLKPVGTWLTFYGDENDHEMLWEEDFEEDGSVWKYNLENHSITLYNSDSSKVESRVFLAQKPPAIILCEKGQCSLALEKEPERQFPLDDLEFEQDRFLLDKQNTLELSIDDLRKLKW